MAIVTSKRLYERCLGEPWAVGGFIGYDMEIMQAAIQGGLDQNAPIMVQASCRVVDYAGADRLYALAQAFSLDCGAPVILHLDHGDTVERCEECIDRGFSSVMLDCTGDSYGENVRKTAAVVRYAHAHGAVAEGEILHSVPGAMKYSTSPEEALRYAGDTGCDSLSVCCGNAHGIDPDFPKKLQLEQIAAIHDALPKMPLVLHATSVFDEAFIRRANRVGAGRTQPHNFTLEELQASFALGVCKVNSALDIKILFTTAIREYMLQNPGEMDPRKYLGYAREEVRKHIAQKHRYTFLDSGMAYAAAPDGTETSNGL